MKALSQIENQTQPQLSSHPSRLILHQPQYHELSYRQILLSQPETMAYNRKADLCMKEYHPETGCIDFPPENWEVWYKKWCGTDTERYYAYLMHISDGAFIGEFSLFRLNEPINSSVYEMGIVLESCYREAGYSKEGLLLLLKAAFETCHADQVVNHFEASRTSALALHRWAGFTVTPEADGIVSLCLSKERYQQMIIGTQP